MSERDVATLLYWNGKTARFCYTWHQRDVQGSEREILTQFFGKSKNVMVERYKFIQRHQRQGESARKYVSALRELAVTCRFGELHDELVRD